jgi:hypothetical protein
MLNKMGFCKSEESASNPDEYHENFNKQLFLSALIHLGYVYSDGNFINLSNRNNIIMLSLMGASQVFLAAWLGVAPACTYMKNFCMAFNQNCCSSNQSHAAIDQVPVDPDLREKEKNVFYVKQGISHIFNGINDIGRGLVFHDVPTPWLMGAGAAEMTVGTLCAAKPLYNLCKKYGCTWPIKQTEYQNTDEKGNKNEEFGVIPETPIS